MNFEGFKSDFMPIQKNSSINSNTQTAFNDIRNLIAKPPLRILNTAQLEIVFTAFIVQKKKRTQMKTKNQPDPASSFGVKINIKFNQTL